MVPPFVAAAVNVRACPVQVGFEPELMLIETNGVSVPVIVIVIPFEVDVAGLAQAKLDVMTQVTTSPFPNELVVYVELLVPTLLPFTFH